MATSSSSSPFMLWEPLFLRVPPPSRHHCWCSPTLSEVSRLDDIGISIIRGGSSDSMRTLVLRRRPLSPSIPSGWQLRREDQPWGCWGKWCQTQLQWV
ncbi:hypothetical protein BS47DRAFT_1380554 [Hydnum rufescens UP504]|uniref:Uncharacterized protein n=1 Tax=Hydnum rufescens UP504 TaxID=1448309 RepID=A0A9P6DW81_9AGAM|nr:hypothetical protein BS47DRAFT_1380554 [Hydnum rufescens UP504]